MKYNIIKKVLLGLNMPISMVFGLSISKVYKGEYEIWSIVFILGFIYTIWWLYNLFKNN